MDIEEGYEPVRDTHNPMFWRIKKKNGSLPRALTGCYTKHALARDAIRQYILHEKYDTVNKPYSSRELQKARRKKCPEATAKSTKTKQQPEE